MIKIIGSQRSEGEQAINTGHNRFQKENKKFLEEVQYQTIVLPPFVDTNYQYMASMLTGESSKINFD